MKKIINGILIFFAAFFAFASFANASNHLLISLPINGDVDFANSVIQTEIGTENIERYFAGMAAIDKDHRYTAQTSTIDCSRYILEYNVGLGFWEKLSSLDYESIVEEISKRPDSKVPTMYIPIYAECEVEGSVAERVVGHVKVSFDYFNQKYKLKVNFFDVKNENFLHKKYCHFYEQINDYMEENDINAEQVFIIRYSSSFNDYADKAAIIVENGQLDVLDFGDSCRMGSRSGEAVSYDIEEYQAKRTEAEKTLQKNYKSWEEVEFGGSQLKKIITDNKTVFPIIAVVIAAAVVALIISLVAVSKKKKG